MGRIGLAEILIWGIVALLIIAKFVLIIVMVMRNKRKQEEAQVAMRRYVDALADKKVHEMPSGPVGE